MRRAVHALVSSPLFDKEERRLAPEGRGTECEGEITLEFLREVYANQARLVEGVHGIDEQIENALELIHTALTNPMQPTTLVDIHRKAFPLESRCLLQMSDSREESEERCHHHPQFTHGTAVLMLWQETKSTGEFDGPPKIVACGRVVYAAKGAIKCRCPQPAVKVVIKGVRKECDHKRMTVPGLIYDAYNEELGVRGFTPFVQQKENDETVYTCLMCVSDLGIGQNWCWPRKLLVRDVDKETEEAEKQQKRADAEKRKMDRKRKNEEKLAAQEAKRAITQDTATE